MSIPDYQTIMLPLLKISKEHSQIDLRSATDIISNQFSLTKEEREQTLDSNKQTIKYKMRRDMNPRNFAENYL